MSGGYGYNPYAPLIQQLGGLYGLSQQGIAQSNSNALARAQQQIYAQYLAQQQNYRAQLGAWFGAVTEREEPPKPPKHEGFVLGELVGHRCWCVNKSGFLTSITADEIWAPDEPMTTKNGVAGIEGRGEGDVGIHAFKLQRHALKLADDWGGGLAPMVWGRVHLWGDIVEHEIGYRAEYARIFAIDGAHETERRRGWFRRRPKKTLLESLKERYEPEEPTHDAG